VLNIDVIRTYFCQSVAQYCSQQNSFAHIALRSTVLLVNHHSHSLG
jgi:hypothetical protein